MSSAVVHSIHGFFNSIYSEQAGFWFYYFFMQYTFLFPIVSSDYSIVFTHKTLVFFSFFSFFMQDALLFPIVSMDFSIVSTEKMLPFLSFYFLYERFPAIANSILSFPNSIYWENTCFFIFWIFSQSFSAIVHSILRFLNSIY